MESALFFLEGAGALETRGHNYQKADYFNTWGLYHWHARNREESIEWYKKTMLLPAEEDILPMVAVAANNISAQYQRLGEPDSAGVYLLKAFETEQQAFEIANLERQARLIRFRHQVVTAGSALIILLLVMFILLLNKRRTISAQKLIIREKEKKLIETELHVNRRELTSIALSLAKSEQLNNKLRTDLQQLLGKTDEETSHELKAALRLLKSKDNSLALWGEFEKRFDELNEGFITRLVSRYPSLSPAELRLCAMLRLQMSTKDIADMIRRSPRTVEHTRNSVRKKMNLKTSDNIIQHLLNL